MSTPCWQRIELTSKFFGQTTMADFERKSAIVVHVMNIVRSAPSIITPATPHHPPPALA